VGTACTASASGTVPEAPLHRAIVDVFTNAAAGYTGRLSPVDVHQLLLAGGHLDPESDPPTVDQVAGRLTQLRLWETRRRTKTPPALRTWTPTGAPPTSTT
jgi:hypothetical protein